MSRIIGFNEDYGTDLQKKDYVMRCFTDTVTRMGYEEIQIPVIEPAVSYSEEIVGASPWPEWDRKSCFYFNIENYETSYLDAPDEVEVLLVPEGTVSVTRWLGNQINSENIDFPVKIFYDLKCYRNETLNSLSEIKRREFQQFGIEILGSNSILSDTEALYVLVECLATVGIDKGDICIRINDLSFYNMLVEDCNISDKDAVRLKELLDNIAEAKAGKETQDLETCIQKAKEFIRRIRVDNKKSTYWDTIIYSEDGFNREFYDVFDQKYHDTFDELNKFKNSFSEHGINLVIDPCVIRSHEYYTGISYEVDVNIEGRKYIEIAGGGRYNRLVSNFISEESTVRSVPCTGFAFGFERVVKIINDAGFFEAPKKIESNFYFSKLHTPKLTSNSNDVKGYFECLKKNTRLASFSIDVRDAQSSDTNT